MCLQYMVPSGPIQDVLHVHSHQGALLFHWNRFYSSSERWLLTRNNFGRILCIAESIFNLRRSIWCPQQYFQYVSDVVSVVYEISRFLWRQWRFWRYNSVIYIYIFVRSILGRFNYKYSLYKKLHVRCLYNHNNRQVKQLHYEGVKTYINCIASGNNHEIQLGKDHAKGRRHLQVCILYVLRAYLVPSVHFPLSFERNEINSFKYRN